MTFVELFPDPSNLFGGLIDAMKQIYFYLLPFAFGLSVWGIYMKPITDPDSFVKTHIVPILLVIIFLGLYTTFFNLFKNFGYEVAELVYDQETSFQTFAERFSEAFKSEDTSGSDGNIVSNTFKSVVNAGKDLLAAVFYAIALAVAYLFAVLAYAVIVMGFMLAVVAYGFAPPFIGMMAVPALASYGIRYHLFTILNS